MGLTHYSEQDFINAVYLLLPPGDYWSKSSSKEVLGSIIASIAKELYLTYLDVSQVLLYQQDNNVMNWRIADYQALLDTYQKNAIASDDPAMPNVITILLSNAEGIIDMMNAVENKRLPHTAINYTLPFGFALASSMRLISYQRIEAIG